MTDTAQFRHLRAAASLLPLLALLSCANVQDKPAANAVTPGKSTAEPQTPATPAKPANEQKPESAKIFKGSGVMIKAPQPEKPLAAGGNTSLNFEAADIRDIAKTVLAEILKESYIVDPKVTGSISFRTTRPLPKEALLPTLETILRMNGIVMIKENGIYKIMPAANAKGSLSPRLGGPLNGFTLQVVPLKYAGARELAKILEAIAPDPSSIKVDELRNLLILAGTQNELQHMLDTVEMFDVDWLAGMSIGLFTLQSADVKSVDTEINKIFNDKTMNPLAGAVRMIPLERLNAFVIISPQAHYLEQAKLWLERLDRAGGEGGGSRLFVYHVQNGKAEQLAELLNQTFGGNKNQTATRPAPTLATGLTPTETRTGTGLNSMQNNRAGFGTTATTPLNNQQALNTPITGSTLSITDDSGKPASEVRVVADKENNALLILANSAGYEKIETALKKLDVAPRQVLIDVTIAEVTLTDDLQYGIEGMFTKGDRKTGILDTGSTSGINRLSPGFSYAITKPGSTALQAVFNIMSDVTKANILSSPHLMVADNQTAKIQVGDSVPTLTSTTSNLGVSTTTGAVVTNTTQYIDTGIMLTVKPRINAGGLVNLELSQEVSLATAAAKDAAIASPTISKRTLQTQVAVQSGDTMVLGGLIRDESSRGSHGLPILSEIPIIGGLFGNQSIGGRKTELILLITPRVVNNTVQAVQITQELERKMGQAKSLLECGTSNVFGYTTRGGLWCLQPGRFDGAIDKMKEPGADGRPVYLNERPSDMSAPIAPQP